MNVGARVIVFNRKKLKEFQEYIKDKEFFLFTDKQGLKDWNNLSRFVKYDSIYQLIDIPDERVIIFDRTERLRNYKSQIAKRVGEIIEAIRDKQITIYMIAENGIKEPMDFFPYGIALRLFSVKTFFPWLIKNGYKKKDLPNNIKTFVYMGTKSFLNSLNEIIFNENYR